jgi:hypothetical protein
MKSSMPIALAVCLAIAFFGGLATVAFVDALGPKVIDTRHEELGR